MVILAYANMFQTVLVGRHEIFVQKPKKARGKLYRGLHNRKKAKRNDHVPYIYFICTSGLFSAGGHAKLSIGQNSVGDKVHAWVPWAKTNERKD